MHIIGSNFTKISAERADKIGKLSGVSTDIEFLDIKKEKIDLLKDFESLSVQFRFSVNYKPAQEDGKDKDKSAQILIEGNFVLSVTADESKEILKHWKKQEIQPELKNILYNTVLRKCSIKALSLEEEFSLPFHIPFPQRQFKKES